MAYERTSQAGEYLGQTPREEVVRALLEELLRRRIGSVGAEERFFTHETLVGEPVSPEGELSPETRTALGELLSGRLQAYGEDGALPGEVAVVVGEGGEGESGGVDGGSGGEGAGGGGGEGGGDGGGGE